ncbi:MAG: lipase maturation factor family protein [Haloglomus sp.]
MAPWYAWSPSGGSFWVARFLLQRGLALTYLIAFLVAARQFRPLVGEDGLLPLSRYTERFAFDEKPSLFYYFDSDRALAVGAWAGVALAALALVGAPTLLADALGFSPVVGLGAYVAVWTAMWALYLSFVNAGQTFYGYGWESMLCECGFLAIFLGAPAFVAPAVVVYLFRWVEFRNMFGAGLIKLRGDNCWSDLSCLSYHYETQPMPNPVSWFAHHLPDRFHRFGVLTNHVVELAVPFLYFGPPGVAAVAGLTTVGFQGWLMLTGNFSFLNFLTIVLAGSLFADPVVSGTLDLLPAGLTPAVPDPAALAALPLAYALAIAGLTVLVVALSYYPVTNMLSERQAMNRAFDPLNLVNTYGAFGSITKTRYEVVVQGTRDETVTADTEWETYEFYGKPTDPERRPPQWAPYHLRLDWQLWFAAMASSPRRSPWFVHMLAKLLAGDEATLSLVRTNPFPEDPPRHVRALRYRYEFTDPETRRETGRWWDRERVGTYYGPVSLSDARFRRTLRRQGWDVPDEVGESRERTGETTAPPGR